MATILETTFYKFIFSNENVWILIIISLKFCLYGPINCKSALVRVMFRRLFGVKSLTEQMMIQFIDAYMRQTDAVSKLVRLKCRRLSLHNEESEDAFL